MTTETTFEDSSPDQIDLGILAKLDLAGLTVGVHLGNIGDVTSNRDFTTSTEEALLMERQQAIAVSELVNNIGAILGGSGDH